MKDRKTLVILTPGFPASVADSTCLPMQQQFIKALKEYVPALEIVVLSFQYPYVSQVYTWYGVTVMSFNGQNKGGFSRVLLRRKINTALKTIYAENEIAGILSFWYNECAWIGNKFAAKYQLKHFCWILGQDARKKNKYPKLLSLPATEMIALSDSLQDEFEKNHTIRPAFVIPPGIDQRLFTQTREKKIIQLLAAGSLIPLKQFELFIEVVAEIKKRIPGVQAVLIGDGPERKKLEQLIQQLNLQSNITLTGELPYPAVIQWMQRCSIFLHPSSYEGFSGVCLEALAAGALVISFCKPMKEDINGWYIVQGMQQMQDIALELLQRNDTATKSIPYNIKDTVKKIASMLNV